MDRRDRYNVIHMRRRLEAASHFPLNRQINCAKHLEDLARKQHRFHLFMLAHMWLLKLQRGEALC